MHSTNNENKGKFVKRRWRVTRPSSIMGLTGKRTWSRWNSVGCVFHRLEKKKNGFIFYWPKQITSSEIINEKKKNSKKSRWKREFYGIKWFSASGFINDSEIDLKIKYHPQLRSSWSPVSLPSPRLKPHLWNWKGWFYYVNEGLEGNETLGLNSRGDEKVTAFWCIHYLAKPSGIIILPLDRPEMIFRKISHRLDGQFRN